MQSTKFSQSRNASVDPYKDSQQVYPQRSSLFGHAISKEGLDHMTEERMKQYRVESEARKHDDLEYFRSLDFNFQSKFGIAEKAQERVQIQRAAAGAPGSSVGNLEQVQIQSGAAGALESDQHLTLLRRELSQKDEQIEQLKKKQNELEDALTRRVRDAFEATEEVQKLQAALTETKQALEKADEANENTSRTLKRKGQMLEEAYAKLKQIKLLCEDSNRISSGQLKANIIQLLDLLQ